MKHPFSPIILAAAVLLTFVNGNSSAADQSADEAAIRALEAQQSESWNRHDATAYANLFAEDGDCVNVLGWWWKGRAEIERKLTDAYAFVFRESALTITKVEVRFLTPEIAIVHVGWTMTGARMPSGLSVPQQGLQTQVVRKRAGKWLISAFQNTNAIPEMPFPKGPPSSPASSMTSPASSSPATATPTR